MIVTRVGRSLSQPGESYKEVAKGKPNRCNDSRLVGRAKMKHLRHSQERLSKACSPSGPISGGKIPYQTPLIEWDRDIRRRTKKPL